ncbi:MAG TPA: DUF692 domain-containing protein, partial [Thermoanaerobaculia bacterium]|nr:DUF692 domain-containing protein [Thermoanaerobaculia bacterium]
GWRPELGAAILGHLDRIDVVEVLAEEFVEATAPERRALRMLASCVPVIVHGTSLGLASTEPVDGKRLDSVARVIGWLEPESWSEHLAFVRAGGIEIGHLAAPPRNDATLDGLMRNVDAARRVVGWPPLLENVASLIDPPFSDYAEGQWLDLVLRATGTGLLLDLHNLHANATNFGFDAAAIIASIDHDRVGGFHLAGGHPIEGNRILDDHLHSVPTEVFDLLAMVETRNATIIIERDGNYPPFAELLAEVEHARRSATVSGATLHG